VKPGRVRKHQNQSLDVPTANRKVIALNVEDLPCVASNARITANPRECAWIVVGAPFVNLLVLALVKSRPGARTVQEPQRNALMVDASIDAQIATVQSFVGKVVLVKAKTSVVVWIVGDRISASFLVLVQANPKLDARIVVVGARFVAKSVLEQGKRNLFVSVVMEASYVQYHAQMLVNPRLTVQLTVAAGFAWGAIS
jgi:hypothetical protein